MGRIQVLSDSTINRIAAGEVVERPASVLKELVENSLDAGARSIRVVLQAGGRQRIRVTDDGCGMDRDDALLAVERHATSKLAEAKDLDSIATLGFRGEALSSIASVSRFTLESAQGHGEGTEIQVHGGRVQSVRQRGMPAGTSITVDRLFFNTPARRKFLRSESTELSHCLRWLTRYALVFPAIRFHLRNGERELLDTPPVEGSAQRIAQIFGNDFAERLLPFEGSEAGLRASGFAGRPVDALSRRDAQHLFVNGRAVQDRVLTHAISEAYGNTMARGRYPSLFLFLVLDPGEVDVNVHPQKTEVRFRQSSRVHDLVRDALGASLSNQAAVPSLSDLRPSEAGPAAGRGIRAAALGYLETHEPSPRSERTWAATARADVDAGSPRRVPGGEPPSVPAVATADLVDAIHDSMDTPGRRAVPLAQFRESYIVAEDRQGLVLVDQHAAHERVLFEKYLEDAEANRVERQTLMFPVTLEMAPQERVVIEAELEELRRLGFGIEPFGGGSVRLDAVPAVAGKLDPARLLRELLGEASRARAAASDVDELRHRLVTTAACHAAIKVNHRLASEAMQGLLDDLFATKNPTTCPHGRPVLFRLTREEIERAFRRR